MSSQGNEYLKKTSLVIKPSKKNKATQTEAKGTVVYSYTSKGISQETFYATYSPQLQARQARFPRSPQNATHDGDGQTQAQGGNDPKNYFKYRYSNREMKGPNPYNFFYF